MVFCPFSPKAAGRWVAAGARFFEAADELSLLHEAASRLVRDYHCCFPSGGGREGR